MKSPIDTVKGVIVGYDDKTSEIIIRARYDDLPMIIKREYKTCLVQLEDSRKLSDKQRRCCYAMLREVSDFTGMGLDRTKEYMKLKFLSEDLLETADKIFSLSNAPMSLVCAFQRFIVRFIIEWDIPCKRPLIEYVDDINDYVYGCLIHRKCCVCGRRAEVHHVDRVGMGRDRTEIIHEGMKVLPLCRIHHTEAHSMTNEAFNNAYHISDGIVADKTVCKIYGLKARKENDGENDKNNFS